MAKSTNEVDLYIGGFPKEIQARLQQIRKTIQAAAPGAEESISYAIPAYKLHGYLVYFAGYKNHIGFYPIPSGMKAFEKELEPYRASKATAQFPHNELLPLDLITKIVKFRVNENLQKLEEKNAAKTNGISTKDFLADLSAPAKRALENEKIKTVQQLSKYSEKEILQLHGIGKTSLPKLKKALEAAGLGFREK